MNIWECQICHQPFDTDQLVDIWFSTDKSVGGRLHGVCPNCNEEKKIQDGIRYYLLKLKNITDVTILSINEAPFFEGMKKEKGMTKLESYLMGISIFVVIPIFIILLTLETELSDWEIMVIGFVMALIMTVLINSRILIKMMRMMRSYRKNNLKK